jgi:hypothetical protein
VPSVEFGGETFTTADRIGLMPLMRFAKVAKAGVDSASMEGLAAMYDMLEQCIAPQDWPRFVEAANRTHADGDELMAVVARVFEVLTERPTSRPSDSSDGPSTTPRASEGGLSSRVAERLEGRPDLQLMVMRAQQAS